MRRLYRSRTEAMIGGVCGGLAEYFAVDPTIVRLFFVFLVLMGGSGLLLYLLFWIIIPPAPAESASNDKDETPRPPAPSVPESRVGLLLGVILIFLGVIFLLRNLCRMWWSWFDPRFWGFYRYLHPIVSILPRILLPACLIVLGLVLLFRPRKGG